MHTFFGLLKAGMASGPGAHLISVVKYEKCALHRVLGFYASGGHILYENMYSTISATNSVWFLVCVFFVCAIEQRINIL